ncbi:MAG: nitroreductase family protein [Myxococcales bacterium]|nr:nitroreductase family protein [Myxococcales bacterium]MDD9969125.1 nitroreductase family protein [Myxococcales bacterium]
MAELSLYEALRTTRAVRRLRPDPIPDAVLARVLTAFTWGPSGGNRQPWRLLVVRAPHLKVKLQRMYQELWSEYVQASRAGLPSLPERSRARAERSLSAGDYLASHLGEVPVVVVVCFDPRGLAVTDAKLGRQSVVGGASIYPAVQNMLLACRAEGLGCVLTTLLCTRESEVRGLLGIPEPWATAAMVPIGYPVGRGHGPTSRRPLSALAFGDRWDEPLALACESE